jgi:SAM-dependent methyltransferase
MEQAMSQLSQSIEANREQLRERIVVDEAFIHMHWESERKLVSYIPRHAQTLLDLGCGPTGGLLMHIPDLRYFGSDFVHEYLRPLQKQHGQERAFGFATRGWTASALESIPFADNSFDVVYARHSLEHTADQDNTLKDIRRVLKPGGVFIFCVPSRVDDTEPTHITRWPARRWKAAFSRVGKVIASGHHPYFIDEFYGCAIKPAPHNPSLIGTWNRLKSRGEFLIGQGYLKREHAFAVRTIIERTADILLAGKRKRRG